ncbi:hypothetical protein [Bradyrhizobium sp. USDA 4504]
MGRRLQSLEISLFDQRKHDWRVGPELRAPAERKLKRSRANGDHHADRPIAIFRLEESPEILLIGLAAEAIEIEAFGVDGGRRVPVSAHRIP